MSRYILHSGQSAAYYYSHSALKINAYEKCVLLRVHPSLSLSYSIIFIQQMNEIFQLQLMDFLHYFGFNREVQLWNMGVNVLFLVDSLINHIEIFNHFIKKTFWGSLTTKFLLRLVFKIDSIQLSTKHYKIFLLLLFLSCFLFCAFSWISSIIFRTKINLQKMDEKKLKTRNSTNFGEKSKAHSRQNRVCFWFLEFFRLSLFFFFLFCVLFFGLHLIWHLLKLSINT